MANRMPRKVPDKIGSSDYLFEDLPIIGMVKMKDGAVALGPSILVLFASQNILPKSLSSIGLLASIFIAGLGLALLIFKPSYLSLSEWVGNYWAYKSRIKERNFQFRNSSGERIDGVEVTSDEDTRDLTDIKQIHPDENAGERTDGVMFCAIQITGANMDTADPYTWDDIVDEFSNRLNTQLRNDFQFFLPMRQFDPTEQIDLYKEREEDDDIKNGTEFMKSYIQDRINWMERIGETSYVREYYIIIKVSRSEIIENTVNAGTGSLETLEELPGGEMLKDIYIGLTGGQRNILSVRDIQEKQFEELEKRKDEIKRLVDVGPGNDTKNVDSNKLGVLLKEFWEGESLREEEAQNLIREREFVVGRSDKEKSDSKDINTGDLR